MREYAVIRHHGIKGQKWGVTNGPPYPLGQQQKSAKEKRFEESSGSHKTKAESSGRKKYWTDARKARAKKVVKGVAITTGVVLALYGGYKVSQIPEVQQRFGETQLDRFFKDKTTTYGGSLASRRVGLSSEQIDRRMVSRINERNTGISSEQNCAHTSVAYILNSMFGLKVRAKGSYGVDEVSGLQRPGRDNRVFNVIFNNIKSITPPTDEDMSTSLASIPSGSTGILYLKGTWFLSGHFMCYEKDSSGHITLIDPQQKARSRQVVAEGTRFFADECSTWRVARIMDLSDATLSEEAESILKYFVE